MVSDPSDPGDDQIQVRIGGEQLYLAPAGASQSRVRGVLPSKGSEDVSHLLGTIRSQRTSE